VCDILSVDEAVEEGEYVMQCNLNVRCKVVDWCTIVLQTSRRVMEAARSVTMQYSQFRFHSPTHSVLLSGTQTTQYSLPLYKFNAVVCGNKKPTCC